MGAWVVVVVVVVMMMIVVVVLVALVAENGHDGDDDDDGDGVAPHLLLHGAAEGEGWSYSRRISVDVCGCLAGLLCSFNHENVLSIKDLIMPPDANGAYEDVYIITELLDTDLSKVHSSPANPRLPCLAGRPS